MKVAERRLQQVEKEKEDIEAKNRKLHEEKAGCFLGVYCADHTPG